MGQAPVAPLVPVIGEWHAAVESARGAGGASRSGRGVGGRAVTASVAANDAREVRLHPKTTREQAEARTRATGFRCQT